jgi:hypothetical protein
MVNSQEEFIDSVVSFIGAMLGLVVSARMIVKLVESELPLPSSTIIHTSWVVP